MSRTTFAIILSTSESRFISGHQYFGENPAHPKAKAISAYDGQIEFIFTYQDNSRDYQLRSAFETAHRYASEFGEVRSFYMENVCDYDNDIIFRAEYFKLSSAEAVLKTGKLAKLILVSSPHFLVT